MAKRRPQGSCRHRAAGVLVLCVLAVPFSEPDAFRHWLQALLEYGSRFDRWQPDISSLAGGYVPFVPRAVERALSVLCVMGGLACAAWLIHGGLRRHARAGSRYWWWALALGTAAWLTLLPYVHPYDDVLLLAPLMVLLARHRGREPQGLLLLAIAGILSVPELDLMGFRPNLTFSYTVLPVLATFFALASWRGYRETEKGCVTVQE